MTRLPIVLDAADLPDAELQAMRLDGQVYALARAWCPVDIVESPALRAHAVMSGRSPRLVAALGTAAWIWGAIPAPPTPVELCADVRARARLRPGAGASVHELVLGEGDVVRWGSAAVTSPLRTAIDLARSGVDDPVAFGSLARAGGFDRAAVVARLRQSRAPGTRRATRALLAASA